MTPSTGRHISLDIDYDDFLAVFDAITAGVIVVDTGGRIIYYNRSMAKIDEIEVEEALHKHVTEIYDLTNRTSMLLKALATRRPYVDRPFYYRTRRGRIANTIHSAFPLFKGKELRGAICFVREYKMLEETISKVSIRPQKSNLGNGTRFTFTSIVGRDADFLQAVNTALMAANTPSPVMLYGETGTGKELFAQAIHNQSARSVARYTPVNCAAIPENLLEGILFGTSTGAFTGARDKPGLFESTSGGTLFLDELNAMPLSLQAKILRVLQEKKVRPLGSFREVEVDLKIVSAVNTPPHVAIAEKMLRPDLFYRLGVVFIPIPPLRDRKGDIERLSDHFLEKHGKALKKEIRGISDEVLEMFHAYHWPGNVRELEHVIEAAMNLAGPGEVLELDHLQSHLPIWYRMRHQPSTPDTHFREGDYDVGKAPRPPRPRRPAPTGALESGEEDLKKSQAEMEKRLISGALRNHGGNVTRAAESIGISRQLLHYKMKKHGISRYSFT